VTKANNSLAAPSDGFILGLESHDEIVDLRLMVLL